MEQIGDLIERFEDNEFFLRLVNGTVLVDKVIRMVNPVIDEKTVCKWDIEPNILQVSMSYGNQFNYKFFLEDVIKLGGQ